MKIMINGSEGRMMRDYSAAVERMTDIAKKFGCTAADISIPRDGISWSADEDGGMTTLTIDSQYDDTLAVFEGSCVDHGELVGLADDDCPQYIRHNISCDYCGVKNQADAPYCCKCGAPLGE